MLTSCSALLSQSILLLSSWLFSPSTFPSLPQCLQGTSKPMGQSFLCPWGVLRCRHTPKHRVAPVGFSREALHPKWDVVGSEVLLHCQSSSPEVLMSPGFCGHIFGWDRAVWDAGAGGSGCSQCTFGSLCRECGAAGGM